MIDFIAKQSIFNDTYNFWQEGILGIFVYCICLLPLKILKNSVIQKLQDLFACVFMKVQ